MSATQLGEMEEERDERGWHLVSKAASRHLGVGAGDCAACSGSRAEHGARVAGQRSTRRREEQREGGEGKGGLFVARVLSPSRLPPRPDPVPPFFLPSLPLCVHFCPTLPLQPW